jgi:hypothetical protein
MIARSTLSIVVAAVAGRAVIAWLALPHGPARSIATAAPVDMGDEASREFVRTFHDRSMASCQHTATTAMAARGAVIDTEMTSKISGFCSCAADYITHNLNNDDVHAVAVTAHIHELAKTAQILCAH